MNPPRPWRSQAESRMVRRYVFYWTGCRDKSRPSGRGWAKQLGISHTWLQKLVREFEVDPSAMQMIQAANGDPKFDQLERSRSLTQQMKEQGKLRERGKRNPRSLDF